MVCSTALNLLGITFIVVGFVLFFRRESLKPIGLVVLGFLIILFSSIVIEPEDAITHAENHLAEHYGVPVEEVQITNSICDVSTDKVTCEIWSAQFRAGDYWGIIKYTLSSVQIIEVRIDKN